MKGDHTRHWEEHLLLVVQRKLIYRSILHYKYAMCLFLQVHCNTWVGIMSWNVSETCMQLNRVIMVQLEKISALCPILFSSTLLP